MPDDGIRHRYIVERYEKLPVNAETEKLLEFEVPPGTKTIKQPWKARERDLKRRR